MRACHGTKRPVTHLEAASGGSVGVTLWTSFTQCNCNALLNPSKKKSDFVILKRMPYCTETSDLLGILEPLTPVWPDKPEVNAEVEKARPVIQLDSVYNHSRGQEFVLWANRVIENY